MGIEFCSTPEATTGSDILSVHLPAIQTQHFINEIRNYERWWLCNQHFTESLLNEQISSKPLGKRIESGLDVFDNEPARFLISLWHHRYVPTQIYVTHHIGASTDQATTSVGRANSVLGPTRRGTQLRQYQTNTNQLRAALHSTCR